MTNIPESYFPSLEKKEIMLPRSWVVERIQGGNIFLISSRTRYSNHSIN